MKTLLLMRHAKSSWKEAGLSDHDRPLNKRGQRDAPRMGQLLKEQRRVPDLILSSTALRARQTTEYVAQACDFTGDLRFLESLYLSHARGYLEVIRQEAANESCVLLVGHNPVMGELLYLLCEQSLTFPTAALAQLEMNAASWLDLHPPHDIHLVSHQVPKELI